MNGFLYSPGDIDGLCETIAFFAEHPEEIRRFGERGYRAVTASLSSRPDDVLMHRIASALKGSQNPRSPRLLQLMLEWERGASTQQLKAAGENHMEELRHLAERHEADLRLAREDYEERLGNAQGEHESQRATAQETHEAQLAAVREGHESQLAATQVAFLAERERLELLLEERVREIHSFRSTRVWRLAERYWRFRDRIAPEGSILRTLAQDLGRRLKRVWGRRADAG
jgi:hypothetical protein